MRTQPSNGSRRLCWWQIVRLRRGRHRGGGRSGTGEASSRPGVEEDDKDYDEVGHLLCYPPITWCAV